MERVVILCKCGKEFETTNSRLKTGRGKFCSKVCKYKYCVRPSNLTYKIVKINKGWFKFKGGWVDERGYRKRQFGDWKIREHRFVMQNYLGRELVPNEVIHHINGNKLDNRIENLLLMTKPAHDYLHSQRRRINVT